MALYNFDLNDNGTLYPDTEGTDLPSLEAAEDEASRALIEIARGRMPDGTFAEVPCMSVFNHKPVSAERSGRRRAHGVAVKFMKN
ncbi:hypothetical protein [Mesorhizobium sp. B2-3-12]|uniref:DUF6894 family protein n=1 Tax=Mesorhizobium sp. B2-3-12 TaxID=2589952 RepID=UPI00112DA809|nr:hypothetical protein [Mesorhizobium sp. B2-3-12]TPL88583.1 hypothetical protein FJ948_20330 [Mesorhizobium sp. B2-3-12]